ncbi:hypothetical protein PM082_018162 [Marasmius tenuissimus]|nr:hypothetical protein PM082_018162 [Marasmius tenuissimus]
MNQNYGSQMRGEGPVNVARVVNADQEPPSMLPPKATKTCTDKALALSMAARKVEEENLMK